jgi:hypothetical protein
VDLLRGGENLIGAVDNWPNMHSELRKIAITAELSAKTECILNFGAIQMVIVATLSIGKVRVFDRFP